MINRAAVDRVLGRARPGQSSDATSTQRTHARTNGGGPDPPAVARCGAGQTGQLSDTAEAPSQLEAE